MDAGGGGFVDNRHMKVEKSALHTGRLYIPEGLNL
jgi:hypothetical protein